MRRFRASLPGLAAGLTALAGLGVLLSAVDVRAQDPALAPVVLTPPVPAEDPAPNRIQVGTLAAVDPSAIGLMDAAGGGLSPDLWERSEKSVIRSVLQDMPVSGASPAMNRLARRLLLTRAPAAGGPAVTAPSLLAVKLQRLWAAGELEALQSLLPQIANLSSDPDAARIMADVLLLSGNVTDAGLLAENASRQSSDPYWLKVAALNQLIAGDDVRADLTLSLAREVAGDDRFFFSAVDVLRKKPKAKPEKFKDLTALNLAIARVLKLPVPKDFLSAGNPPFMRHFLASGEIDGQTRLGLVERLGMMGLAQPSQLAELYAAMPLKEDERSRPVDAAVKSAGTRARAILFQGARTAVTTDGQAAAAAAGLALNGDPALSVLLAEANRGLVLSLPQAPILVGYAGALGRLAALAGDANGAIRWLDNYRGLAQAGTPVAADLAGLAVIIAMADPSGARAVSPADLDLTVARASKLPLEQRAARINVLYACLSGLGLGPSDAGRNIGFGNTGSGIAALNGLETAAAAGRIGETAGLALQILGTAGPSAADPRALEAVLRSLVRVGLGNDARRIAVEAALSHGL